MRIEGKTVEFSCDGRIPDRVQIRSLSPVTVELDWDVVAAAREILGVQGLMDVADEVEDEFQGFVAGAEWVGSV